MCENTEVEAHIYFNKSILYVILVHRTQSEIFIWPGTKRPVDQYLAADLWFATTFIDSRQRPIQKYLTR